MPNELAVLVIDKNEFRGRSNCNVFAGIGCKAFWYSGERYARVHPNATNPPDPPGKLAHESGVPTGSFDLVLLHHTNADLAEGLKISAECTLRYTGGSPPESGGWIAARGLRDQAPIATKEALDIVTWIDAGMPDSVQTLPSLLRRAELQVLPAMAILCEVYLSVYAKANVRRTERTLKAIEMMGWQDAMHTKLVIGDLADVSRSDWWYNAMGLGPAQEEFPSDETTELKSLIARAQREWGVVPLPRVLRSLFESLERGLEMDCEIVAEAYSALVGRLGRVQ